MVGEPDTSATAWLSLSTPQVFSLLSHLQACLQMAPSLRSLTEPLLLAASPPSTPLCCSPEPALRPLHGAGTPAYRIMDRMPLVNVTRPGRGSVPVPCTQTSAQTERAPKQYLKNE